MQKYDEIAYRGYGVLISDVVQTLSVCLPDLRQPLGQIMKDNLNLSKVIEHDWLTQQTPILKPIVGLNAYSNFQVDNLLYLPQISPVAQNIQTKVFTKPEADELFTQYLLNSISHFNNDAQKLFKSISTVDITNPKLVKDTNLAVTHCAQDSVWYSMF